VGYTTLAILAGMGNQLSDAECRELLERIEHGIHAAPNRAREGMHNALIAIGGYRASLRADALAAARRIGRVEIDHGATGCKTPDAVAYIVKMADRQGRSKHAKP
jgi:hypothetical protein